MKKTNKKILAIIAMVVIMATIIPFSASYAATTTISVDSVNVGAGEEVSVDVKLDGNFSAEAVTETLTFDKTKLEVVEVKLGDIAKARDMIVTGVDVDEDGNEVSIPAEANNAGAVVGTFASSANKSFATGVFFTVKFKAKADVSGEQALTLTSEIDKDGEDISDTVTTKSGKVNVIVPITKVTLDKTSATINVGETDNITATVVPENTTESKTVTWTSSDDAVATVSNGTVTAVAPGTATITATAGSKSATYTVEVKAPLTGIALNKTSTSLLKGQSIDLSVKYTPANTTDDKTVTWTTSDDKVATVENGKVTALKEGEATITATVGAKTATCTVTATEKKLSLIELNDDFELALGDSTDLTVKFTPEDTTDDKTVTWTSSDNKVVKVENGKVTALKVGEATITATVGTKTATVKVTVPEVLVEGITAEVDSSKIEVGKIGSIVVTTTPEKVTEEVTTIFASSDDTIAKVDENGIVTAVKVGKATITVKVNDKFEKTIDVEVIEAAVEEAEETNTNTEANTVVPKTGDIAIGAFVVLIVISIVGIAVIVRKKLAK